MATDRWNKCLLKPRYASAAEAGRANTDPSQSVYFCGICSAYHLGHPNVPGAARRRGAARPRRRAARAGWDELKRRGA